MPELRPGATGLGLGMNNETNPRGRISDHFKGLGTVTPEMVRRRAEELARINGRSADQITETDLSQAQEELMGLEPASPADEGPEPLPESKRWDPIPASQGRKVNNMAADDEQTVAETLVEEGIEEAEHDRMVEGTREITRRDELS